MNRASPSRAIHETYVLRVLTDNSDDLLRYFLRRTEEAQDAADHHSEVMEIAWRRRGRVPKEDREARMWLYGIARNVLRNRRRARTTRTATLVELTQILRIAQQAGSSQEHDDAIDVRRALTQLDPSDRELLILVHWDGFTRSDAALPMGLNASTARSRYMRALAKLRVILSAPIGTSIHG